MAITSDDYLTMRVLGKTAGLSWPNVSEDTMDKAAEYLAISTPAERLMVLAEFCEGLRNYCGNMRAYDSVRDGVVERAARLVA